MINREPLGDTGTHRVSDDRGSAKAGGIHEGAQVLGHVRQSIARRRAARIAVPPLRECESVDAAWQQGEQPLERVPRISDPVEEDHGRAVRCASFNEAHPNARRQPDEFLHDGSTTHVGRGFTPHQAGREGPPYGMNSRRARLYAAPGGP